MRHSLSLQIAAILIITAEIVSAAPALKQKPFPHPKTPFSLSGERLPVTTRDVLGDPRNERWQDIARVLRVRDLRVYQWPSAYNVAGGAERQKRKTLAQLKIAGYHVEQVTWHWDVAGYPPSFSGFRAKRGNEILSALWTSNGSYLFLYWGHPAPITPAGKRDDGLIAAVIAGHESDAKEFLKQGANPNAVDYGGDSVLVLAAVNHRARIVAQLFTSRKARSANAPAPDFSAAMKIAGAANDTATLQVFLNAGASPTQIGDALQVATSYGAVKAAKLIAPQAPQESIDRALVTAAFVEEWRGSPIQYPAVVELLIPYKPSQSALDAALVAAAEDDEANIVPILLAAGANVEARNSGGDTALLRAAADPHYNAPQPAVHTLLNSGADPNARDKKGNTALMIAAIANGPPTVALLLSHGADPTARNNNKETALEQVQSLIKTFRGSEKARYLEIIQLLQATESQGSKS